MAQPPVLHEEYTMAAPITFETETRIVPAPRGRKLVSRIRLAVFPMIVVLIAIGLWLALVRTSTMSDSERVRTWMVIVALLAVWLIVIAVLARLGVYSGAFAVPLVVLLSPALGLFLFTRVPHGSEVLHSTPMPWLIGFMVYRLLGGLVWLRVLRSREVAKPWFNISAGSLDLIIGATAIPVAFLVSTGSSVGLVIGVTWNVVGLLDFVIAIVLARIHGGGPQDMLSLRTPIVNSLRPSITGIVAFAVPIAIMVHILSLWQLLAR